MRVWLWSLVGVLAWQGPVQAQEVSVPQVVIDQCNATVKGYDAMPDCLRGGTIGHGMLELAAGADFYGEMAREVTLICAARNETYETQWICLKNAAAKAVEIRQMIGEENMTDRCYRALSNPDVHERLVQAARDLRRDVAGEGFFGGATMYAPFKGCPNADAAEVGTGAAQDDHADHEDHAAPIEDNGGYSEGACSAYREVEAGLTSRSEGELRAALAALRAMPEDQRLNALTGFGVSEASVAVLRQELEGEAAMGTGFLLMGLLKEAHPALFAEAVATQGASEGEFGQAVASGMADFLLDGIVDGYRTFCAE